MDISRVIEHFLMSLLPWIVGTLLGGGLGVVFALFLRFVFSALPKVRWLLPLIPWRTKLMGLLVVVFSPFIVVKLGLGPTAGGVMVGLSMLLLAIVAVVGILIEHWYPEPLAVRLIGAMRTLVTGAVVLAYGVGFVGGGGIGFIVVQSFNLMNYKMAWQGVGAVVGLLLVFDLVFGVPQVIVAYMMSRRAVGEQAKEKPA